MELTSVSLDLLSEDEQTEYNGLLENIQKAEAGPTKWRYNMVAWIYLVWLPVTLLAFSPVVAKGFAPDSPLAALDSTVVDRMVAFALVALLGGPVLIIVWGIKARRAWVREHQHAASRAVAAFLDRIDYEARAKASRGWTSNYDDFRNGLSIRASQHLWYREHSELNWEDREEADRWGMDVDEYVQWKNSNHRD